MRLLIISIIIGFNISCQISSELKHHVGIYEFEYPYNTKDLNENHKIVLIIENDTLRGKYYGTSDEFDEDREGYYPGFFVADMCNLRIENDSIYFSINISNKDLLIKKVDININSTKDAIQSGNKNWGNKIHIDEKQYMGQITKNQSIIFTDENGQKIKTFKKI
jgi:hypothetical protein